MQISHMLGRGGVVELSNMFLRPIQDFSDIEVVISGDCGYRSANYLPSAGEITSFLTLRSIPSWFRTKAARGTVIRCYFMF